MRGVLPASHREGCGIGLDLDGLLDVCDLTMDDLQAVGQQVNSHPHA